MSETFEYAVRCRRHGISHPYASYNFASRNVRRCNCPDAHVVTRTVTRSDWTL